ncbi:putative Ig domain-containing protein [Vibrio kyushuensis]|uniref:Ig domain-containing protein n=1 Tax=Vibrio kyushuensis TaxID=2910249 RepID=UPI003D0B3F7E
MKPKQHLLNIFIAIALVGCSDSSSIESPNPDPEPKTRVIKAIDGYLYNADVALGSNCEIELLKKTDQNGEIEIPSEYDELPVCVTAISGQTVDMSRGLIQGSGFTLRALTGDIVNPMTQLVHEIMESDSTLSLDEATVLAKQGFAALDVNGDLIFGDYIEQSENDENAQALTIIAELLVDNHVLSADDKMSITTLVSEDVSKKIESEEDIRDYFPTIESDSNGSISISPNHRPNVIDKNVPDDINVIFEEAINHIYAADFFEDKDGDELTYSMDVLGSLGRNYGLNIDRYTGVISGTPSAAGNFTMLVYAHDGKVRSNPASISLTVQSENLPPVVNEQVKAQIQKVISNWSVVQGEYSENHVNIDGLFVDPENDTLSYSVVISQSSLRPTVNENILSVTGTAQTAGDTRLTISASDSVNASVKTNFSLNVEEGQTPSHPLENQVFYTVSHSECLVESVDECIEDNDSRRHSDWYLSVQCSASLFENNVLYHLGNRDAQLTGSCPTEQELRAFGYQEEYEVVGDSIIVHEDQEFYDDITLFATLSDTDAFLINLKETEHSDGHILWEHNIKFTAFVNISDAENLMQINLASNNNIEFYLPSNNGHNGFGYLTIAMPTSSTVELSIYNPFLGGLICDDVEANWGDISLNSRTYHLAYRGEDHTTSDFFGTFEDRSESGTNYCSVLFEAETAFKKDENLVIFAGSTEDFEYISLGIKP